MPPRPPPPPVTASGTQSFFVGAPLTKLTGIIAVVTYFSARNSNHGTMLPRLAMDSVRVYEKGEVHRYFTAPLTFGTPAELIPVGMLLVYSLRQVEREMSTRKAALFVLYVHGFAMACQALMIPYLLYGGQYSHNLRYTGPYALLGALGYLYHVKTPRITTAFVRILGFSFSDKVFQYAWFAYAAGAGGSGSFSSALLFVVGAVAAYVYDRLPCLSTADIPDVVASWVSTAVGMRFWANGPPRTIVPGRGGVGRGGLPPPPLARAVPVAAVPPPQAVTADPAAIEQLTMMGFPRPRVVEALQATNNDVQRAADRLLMQS